jgi:hypothetical protein
MATLQEMLLRPDVYDTVVADCQALVQAEVDAKGGISGAAIKTAFKAVTSFAPGYYTETLRSILPEFVHQLQPFWADFTFCGGAEFGDYLVKRGDEVCAALLTVTDNMARESGRAVLVKAYQLVRGGAGKNIEAALPALGAMVQKYA